MSVVNERMHRVAARAVRGLWARRWLVVQLALIAGVIGGLLARREQPREAFQTIGTALLAGLAAGLVLAAILEAADHRIRSVTYVRNSLGLPLLGAQWASTSNDESVALLSRPYDEEAESYRILRANLDFATLDPALGVILVTSAVDGEGRTRTAANLAVAFAREGRHVALADLHLRYPAIAGRFGLEGRPGLTDVVIGHVPLSSALARVDLASDDSSHPPVAPAARLDVLPAGPEPVDPADVVHSTAVTNVVDQLRRSHELVVLDAPPLLPVSDARALSALADAMIVVTNFRLLSPRILDELRKAVDTCAAVPLGFVAVEVPVERHDPYGGYYFKRRRGAVKGGAA